MSTKYDKTKESINSINTGYEGNDIPYDYVIPSCGLEDVDYAVFNLFNKQIPLFYEINNEVKKVPVIFATGERFAILRRRQPITDRTGALILPLISISRGSIENVPSKGISNNQMIPEVITKRIAESNTVWRQNQNFEGLDNLKHTDKVGTGSLSFKPQIKNNIYETIEVPPVKYFGVSYEITIWASFTQQMNKLITAIMSAYTLNPGQQFRIESEKGYWFPAFIDSSFSQDTNYADYTDAERYIKYTMSLSSTGYIIAPNIEGGKVGLRSLVSALQISFEVMTDYDEVDPIIGGIQTNDPSNRILEDIEHEDIQPVAQRVGSNTVDSLDSLYDPDKRGAFVVGESNLKPYDQVGEKSTDHSKLKKVYVRDINGKIIEAKSSNTSGEIVYDQKYAASIFNISNIDK